MGAPPKLLDEQSLAAHLSCDTVLTVQWKNNWLVTFNAFKIKLVAFPLLWVNPESVLSGRVPIGT